MSDIPTREAVERVDREAVMDDCCRERRPAVIRRLICAIKDHAYSDKTVLELDYVRATMATCDRCGAGNADLAFARAVAIPYQGGRA